MESVLVLCGLALLHQFLILHGVLHFYVLDLTHLVPVFRHRVRAQIRIVLCVLFLCLVLGVCDKSGMAQLHAIVFEPNGLSGSGC